jgi:hypothetical protein
MGSKYMKVTPWHNSQICCQAIRIPFKQHLPQKSIQMDTL